MLIGLSGHCSSGKDTVGEYLVKEWGYVRFAFGDKLKEFLLAIDPLVYVPTDSDIHGGVIGNHLRLATLVKLYGWDKVKQLQDVRRLLQRTGTEAMRNIIDQDAWIICVDAARYANDQVSDSLS